MFKYVTATLPGRYPQSDVAKRTKRSTNWANSVVSSSYQYGKDLSDVAFNEKGNGVIATFSDSTLIVASILLGADGPRSKVREFAMLGTDRASVRSFPIWHHNMTVCYEDADKARYLRQQFPTSYLALSQRSFHAFQSSEFSHFLPLFHPVNLRPIAPRGALPNT